MNVVKTDRTITFISDRHTGLLESIPITFPSAHHAFFLQHLQRNLQDKMRYTNKMHRVGLLSKFRECAYAPTVSTFNSSLERFKTSGRQVAMGFLKDLPSAYWEMPTFGLTGMARCVPTPLSHSTHGSVRHDTSQSRRWLTALEPKLWTKCQNADVKQPRGLEFFAPKSSPSW